MASVALISVCVAFGAVDPFAPIFHVSPAGCGSGCESPQSAGFLGLGPQGAWVAPRATSSNSDFQVTSASGAGAPERCSPGPRELGKGHTSSVS